MRKKYFYIFFIILILLFFGIIFFKKPLNILVSTYTYPYSIVSSNNTDDYINIELLLSDKNNCFTSIDQIVNAYLNGEEGEIKLKIEDISIKNTIININNTEFYTIDYKYKIDFNSLSQFDIFISKCYLNMEFTSGMTSNIYIGSFSFFKYNENPNDISISSLKTINKNNKDVSSFYGFQIGIRNYTNKDIIIDGLSILDGNIKNIKSCIIDKIQDNTIENIFNNKTILRSDNLNVVIKANDVIYLAFDIGDNTYELSKNISSVGMKIDYNDKVFYFEKFNFYNVNYYPDSSNLKIYEYANN